MGRAGSIVLGFALGSMASCSDGSSGPSAAMNATTVVPATATPQTNLGVNLNTIDYWDGSRPFANLIYGSNWQMQAKAGWEDVPPGDLDSNGWIKSLPAGYHAERVLSMPMKSADIVCRWQGNDHNSMTVQGDAASKAARVDANSVHFRYAASYPKATAWAALSFVVDPSNYVRNVVCRETSATTRETFDSTLISTLHGFGVIRFMKWQPAVESNRTVNWATRNKPGDGSFLGNDGVPVEQMVALANEVGADPWFCMPWNADSDYIRRFATYVRDNLASNRKVYVEVSNEVWNGSYPVSHQAQKEGITEGLDSSQGAYGQALFRYAEKTQQVMQIWSSVFTGKTKRLVRVISGQNVSPFWTRQMLAYGNTAQSVDALATAPYWAFHDSDFTGQSLDQIMNTVLPAQVNATLDWAGQQKTVAQKYGKRYIAYEGGQDVLLTKNTALVGQIERDPRMFDLYRSYINRWNADGGDTLTFFALSGPIGTAGYGLVEYPGQPLTDAPKMSAVRSFLGRPRS